MATIRVQIFRLGSGVGLPGGTLQTSVIEMDDSAALPPGGAAVDIATPLADWADSALSGPVVLTPKIHKVALAALDTAGGALSWLNPEGVDIFITRIWIEVTTIATGPGTLSVGTTAVSATTSSANLIDTLDVHSATGLFDNKTDAGSLGKTRQKLLAGKWITGSKASGALAGLVGNVYIEYIRPT